MAHVVMPDGRDLGDVDNPALVAYYRAEGAAVDGAGPPEQERPAKKSSRKRTARKRAASKPSISEPEPEQVADPAPEPDEAPQVDSVTVDPPAAE